VSNPAAFITEAGFVRLTASANFSITWGAGLVLRDLLGFSQGNLAGASTYTAASRSSLLYSPGKTLTPERSPLDTLGEPVLDASESYGPNGRVVVRQHGDPSHVQVFSGRYIPLAKYWHPRPTALAGSWVHFVTRELWTAPRLIVLRRVDEGSGSTTASADYSTSAVLGPYRPEVGKLRQLGFAREAGYERVEAYYPISLPVVLCEEFS
jgi:hypothetical protein